MSEVKVWAEIGINHQGSMETALTMVKKAWEAGCYGVKFQKRTPRLVLGDRYDNPRPESRHNFGDTEGEHMEAREFTLSEHVQMRSYAEKFGLEYSCSTWDIESTRQILQLNPNHIKLASPMNTNDDIINMILTANVPTYHVSLGMTTREYMKTLMTYFSGRHVVWYACTSCYPCDNRDLYLLEISAIRRMAVEMGNVDHFGFEWGFSGHHRGIAPDIAAYTIGASWFERHFTLDRTMNGSDHAASLEPEGLERLVRDLKSAEESLGLKPATGIADCEIPSMKKLRGENA